MCRLFSETSVLFSSVILLSPSSDLKMSSQGWYQIVLSVLYGRCVLELFGINTFIMSCIRCVVVFDTIFIQKCPHQVPTYL